MAWAAVKSFVEGGPHLLVAPTGYGKSTYENGPTEEGRCRRSCAEASNNFGQTLSDGPTRLVNWSSLVPIGPHWSSWSPLVPVGPHLPKVGPSGFKHKKTYLS